MKRGDLRKMTVLTAGKPRIKLYLVLDAQSDIDTETHFVGAYVLMTHKDGNFYIKNWFDTHEHFEDDALVSEL